MKVIPDLRTFLRLSKNNNTIVLSYKFYNDYLTPISIYYSLSKKIKGESFLLESVEGDEKISRFSFLGFFPLYTFKSLDKKIWLNEKTFLTETTPLDELKKIFYSFKVAPKQNLRFFGGFVGYIGYDLIRFYEPVGEQKRVSLNVPDLYLILPKFLIVFDHIKKEIEVLIFVLIKEQKNLKNIYEKEVDELRKLIKIIENPLKLPTLNFVPKKLKYKSNFKKVEFIRAVKKAKAYIKEGEAIQVVLSQRFCCEFNSDPFSVYRYLRILNPSPYMFYLNFKNLKIVGSSPEMLLRCENRKLITRPIAGTRKRGKDEAEDEILEKSLLSDPKEQAEHIMLVDLARNDLGRVAESKSVKVPIFMKIEKFSHVMHIVSEVEAKLDYKKDIFDALVSCFPAGTVAGAPKVKAMQIINELEPDKRGIYAGCVGYFSFTNSLDTCIIIRTIIFYNKKAYTQAGAGIVYDSKPQLEYKETLNKAKAQILALSYAIKN